MSSTHTYRPSSSPSSATQATRATLLPPLALTSVDEVDAQAQSSPDTPPWPPPHPNDRGCAVAAVTNRSSSTGQLEDVAAARGVAASHDARRSLRRSVFELRASSLSCEAQWQWRRVASERCTIGCWRCGDPWRRQRRSQSRVSEAASAASLFFLHKLHVPRAARASKGAGRGGLATRQRGRAAHVARVPARTSAAHCRARTSADSAPPPVGLERSRSGIPQLKRWLCAKCFRGCRALQC